MGKYDPKQIEPKWQKEWEKKPYARSDDFDAKPKYYALTEFPYPSGEGLHTGHAFMYTIPDIFARWKRMSGYNVLFPMGWDAFGLPAENYAVKTGIQPAVITRKNTTRFKEQMQSLGLSFDWSREINTTDPDYFKWTQWIFVQLFKNGLAYKSATPVGWCPSCKIVLANEEIVNGRCERCGTAAEQRVQSQWVLRITSYADRLDKELDLVDYPGFAKISQRNWIGRKEGARIKFKIKGTDRVIEVFTTRPDTIYGATFVVVSPDHPVVAGFFGRGKEIMNYLSHKLVNPQESHDRDLEKTGIDTDYKAINPANGDEIPIWISDYVLATIGTGAIMGVPGHDKRDFEFAKKFHLPVIRVVEGPDHNNSKIDSVDEFFEEEGTVVNSDSLNGLKTNDAFEKIIETLKKRGLASKMTTYHLRDWIFSRQHYWGEPIPMIFCPACAKKNLTWWDTKEGKAFKPLFNPQVPEHFDTAESPVILAGWFPLAEKQLPLKLPEVERYQPTETGESPLANIRSWVETTCPNCGGPATRETDTMPNWAGSSWYYLRFADPDNNSALADPKKLNYWQPVDVYFGGAEHTTLHLLYSRFWHKFLNDIGMAPEKEPYAARRQHGLILAEDGSKMSKSKGNVINPDDMISRYGADALRLYLAFMGPYDQTMPWSTSGIEGVRRFLNRVWQIYHSDEKIAEKTTPGLSIQLNRTIKRTGDSIANQKQNTGVAAMMEFLNNWEEPGATLSEEDAGKLLTILAPFAPYISEELWHELGRAQSVHVQTWPEVEKSSLENEERTIVISVNGKPRSTLVFSTREIGSLTEDKLVEAARKDEKVAKYLAEKTVKKTVYVPGRILNFVV